MLNVLALYRINVQSVVVDMFFLVVAQKAALFLVVRVHSTVTYALLDACAVI